ncbi:MAG: right-handed parallel beta-helix repeat-containing protein [Dehalococcoidia bacterium]
MRSLLWLAIGTGLTLVTSAVLVFGVAACLRSEESPAGTPSRADMRASIDAAMSGSVDQQACRVTLTPGEDIGAAIAVQPIGAVVCLTPGVHHAFVVQRSVSAGVVVRGEDVGSTVIQSDGYDTVSVTDAERFTITGVTIRGGAPAGVYAGRARGLSLRNVRIEASGFGVHADEGARVSLADVTITGSTDFGMLIRHGSSIIGDRVRVFDSQGIAAGVTEGAAGLTLRESEIGTADLPGPADAMIALDAAQLVLDGVLIHGGNPTALYAARIGDLTLRNVQVDEPMVGIHIDDGTPATLEDVTVNDAASIGILIRREASVMADRLWMQGTIDTGVLVSEAGELVLRDSAIEDGQAMGVRYQDGAAGAVQNSSILNNADIGLCITPASAVAVENTTIRGNRVNSVTACGGPSR